jgi:hypothetical protein
METRASSMEVMFVMLYIGDRTGEESSHDYRQRVWSRCIEEIQRINQLETNVEEINMTATIRRLFKEREDGDNEEILLLPNKMREIAEMNALVDEPG